VSKHTPGTWKAIDVDCIITDWPDDELTVDDGHYGTVARVYCHTDEDTTRANARLIAAAPDLLAACKAALVRLETIERDKGIHSHETLPELRAVISNATGNA